MNTDTNKAIVRRILEELFADRNLAAVDKFFAYNHINHTPAPSLGLLFQEHSCLAWAGLLRLFLAPRPTLAANGARSPYS